MFNNRSYYNSERHEELVAKTRGRSTDNRVIGTRIEKPPVDFAKLAQSFGLYGEGPIEDPEDLHPALKRAVTYTREKKEPALVDVVTQSVWALFSLYRIKDSPMTDLTRKNCAIMPSH